MYLFYNFCFWGSSAGVLFGGSRNTHSTFVPAAQYGLPQNSLIEKVAFFYNNDNGIITTKELETVMRSRGQNPTVAQLRDVIKTVDVAGNGITDLPEFLHVMVEKYR